MSDDYPTREQLIQWQKDAADERIELRHQIGDLLRMIDACAQQMERIQKQRDEAREVADKLAEDFEDASCDIFVVHGDRCISDNCDCSARGARMDAAYEAWKQRSWRD